MPHIASTICHAPLGAALCSWALMAACFSGGESHFSHPSECPPQAPHAFGLGDTLVCSPTRTLVHGASAANEPIGYCGTGYIPSAEERPPVERAPAFDAIYLCSNTCFDGVGCGAGEECAPIAYGCNACRNRDGDPPPPYGFDATVAGDTSGYQDASDVGPYSEDACPYGLDTFPSDDTTGTDVAADAAVDAWPQDTGPRPLPETRGSWL